MVNANQEKPKADCAYRNSANERSTVDVAKPDFFGENVRSWLQSVEEYFAAQQIELAEHSSVRFVVSYMSGERLQWWELLSLQQISINTFSDFKEKCLPTFGQQT